MEQVKAKKQEKIKFITNDPEKKRFFTILRKRVNAHFKEKGISKHANSQMVIKTIVLITLYIVPFLMILFIQMPYWVDLLLWSLVGFSLAGIGMSVMHDSIHDAYSKNKIVNKALGHSINLLGGSVLNWKLQHNVLHHTYTNIANMDDDVANKLIMRFSPNAKSILVAKYQYIYAFLFYGIVTLFWTTGKDFIQYFKYVKSGVNSNTPMQNKIYFVRLVADKILYYIVFVGLPIYLGNIPVWQVVTGFLLMHFVAGNVLTIIFQLAHVVEGTTHPMPNEEGNIENDWAIHQIETTANFSKRSKFLTWYVGGLNYQIEHHLFPRICHIHYPEIAPIVRKTAEEFGVNYIENDTFMQALRSHILLLKEVGQTPSLEEAIV